LFDDSHAKGAVFFMKQSVGRPTYDLVDIKLRQLRTISFRALTYTNILIERLCVGNAEVLRINE